MLFIWLFNECFFQGSLAQSFPYIEIFKTIDIIFKILFLRSPMAGAGIETKRLHVETYIFH